MTFKINVKIVSSMYVRRNKVGWLLGDTKNAVFDWSVNRVLSVSGTCKAVYIYIFFFIWCSFWKDGGARLPESKRIKDADLSESRERLNRKLKTQLRDRIDER